MWTTSTEYDIGSIMQFSTNWADWCIIQTDYHTYYTNDKLLLYKPKVYFVSIQIHRCLETKGSHGILCVYYVSLG